MRVLCVCFPSPSLYLEDATGQPSVWTGRVPAVRADPPSSHQRDSHRGLGLKATEGPLRSRPKATSVPSWTWQALRVTSQLDLKTPASSMNFHSPFPDSLLPQAENSPVPVSCIKEFLSLKGAMLPYHTWLRFAFKGTSLAEGVVLCPPALLPLGLDQEFVEGVLFVAQSLLSLRDLGQN